MIGNASETEELSWGSHLNKSFLDIIEEVYEEDKIFENIDLVNTGSGNITFIYPFGFCINFEKYDAGKDIRFHIESYRNETSGYKYEAMYIFITDPKMMTFSGINLQSHKGTKIFGLKKGQTNIYDVEVVIKDFDNPAERDFCSQSYYTDCVDQQTHDIFSEVIP